MQWWEPIRLFNKLRHAIYRKASCKADEKDVPGCEALPLNRHRTSWHQASKHNDQWQVANQVDRFRTCSVRTRWGFITVNSWNTLLHGSWGPSSRVRQVVWHMVTWSGALPDSLRVLALHWWQHQATHEEHMHMWLLIPCARVVTNFIRRQGSDQELPSGWH